MKLKVQSSAAGFTLLELLITMAIVSILLALGIAGLRSQLYDAQTRDVSSSLHASLALARGESIKRGGWVNVCASDNGSSCNGSFEDGWVIFSDSDRDSTLTSADQIIKRVNQSKSSVEIKIESLDGNAATNMTFNYRGYPNDSFHISVVKSEYEQIFVLNKAGMIEK